jgi:hypothetical protein
MRLAVRAVKAAVLAFIEAKRRALTEGADGSGAGFSQEGMVELDLLQPLASEFCYEDLNQALTHESVRAASI